MRTVFASPLLILGAGSRDYREYGLRDIGEHYPVALLDPQPPAWARAHAAVTVPVDLHDDAAVFAVAREVGGQRGVSGVLTYMEHHVHLAARLAEELGMAGSPPAAVAAARDKHTTRALLAAAGVPSARSFLAYSADAAVGYAEAIGYPVVIKPRSLGGSAGVRRADSGEDVREAFRAAASARILGLETGSDDGVLVEEYLDGPEISVECVVLGPGDVHIVAVTRKQLGAEPTFEEVGHLVNARDLLTPHTRIRMVAAAALGAIGITHGVMHVEMRLVGGVNPHVVEINARLGGDLIPRLVHLATGVNLPLIAAALAAGEQVKPEDLQYTRIGCAAVRFVYPTVTGRVTHPPTPDFNAAWLHTYAATARTGSDVSAPPHATLQDRLAHIVVTGDTPQTCHDRISLVEQITTPTVTATPHTTACVA